MYVVTVQGERKVYYFQRWKITVEESLLLKFAFQRNVSGIRLTLR